MAVMVCSGAAAQPSNCTLLWCSKWPHNSVKILGELKYVVHSHTTGKLTLSKSKTNMMALWSSSPALLLRSRTSPSLTESPPFSVRCIPICTVPLFPFLHFWRSQTFPTPDHCGQQRTGSITYDVFRSEEEKSRASLLVHLPHCLTFSRKKTIFSPVSIVRSKSTYGWKPSHTTPVASLYPLTAVCKFSSFQPQQSFLLSPQILSLPGRIFKFLHILTALPMLCPLLLLHSHLRTGFASSSRFSNT